MTSSTAVTASPSVASDAELELAFSIARNPGAYALLVGAGISLEAGMPSAWEVQQSLIRMAAATAGADPVDPLAWWVERAGAEPRYDDLIERLAPTATERQALLRHFFEPRDRTDGNSPTPSPAHRAIARLVARGHVRVVVTLNFDHLLEDALRAEGVVPTVVSTGAEITAMAPLHTQRALVVHLHGDYLNPSSMLNTADELGAYDAGRAGFIARLASEYGLVLAGWSGVWDPALRAALVGSPNPFYSTWWIEPFGLTAEGQRLQALRRALVIEDCAGSALGRLADAADAITQTGARHPATPAVAVASAKRALRGEYRAIALHDELRGEFARLTEHLIGSAPPVRTRDVRAEIHARIRRFDEAGSVLTALVATTAYWGGPETDGWWLDELPRLVASGAQAGPGATGGPQGIAALDALGGYPATTLFYAAGVGATAAGRFEVVHRLLNDVTMNDPVQGNLSAGESLAADRTLLIPQASRAVYGALTEPFVRHLALGRGGYDEAWEAFVYLHALERAFARTPDTQIAELVPLASVAWAEHPWGPTYLDAARLPDERRLRSALAALRAVDLPVPHLRGGGYGDRLYPRASARLRRDLNNLEHAHPLVEAGFCDGDLDALRVMVSLTDEAIAAAARRGGGPVHAARDGWLDEVETPEKRSL